MKNYPLVREIAARLPRRRLHIVGAFDEPCPHAVHHGVLADRRELFSLLGRAKTLACPSLLDAAPVVLFEASAMGCNVVATKNCGNWELCHEELAAERCTADDLVEHIERSLSRPYADNRDRFRGGYAELVDALERTLREWS
jgi:glycosyltransferase involved in cell wall biosynthesis